MRPQEETAVLLTLFVLCRIYLSIRNLLLRILLYHAS